jgi:hypothetical protein
MIHPMYRWLILLLAILLAACEPTTVRSRGRDRESRRYEDREDRISRREAPPESLHAPRPRLMANEDDFARVRQLIETDPVSREWFQTLRSRAEQTLQKPPTPTEGQKLLNTSRETLLHVSQLAGMYQLTHDERFARRAIDEMLQVCRFRDWHPDEEFLATAEMTTAVSVGYDWLYPLMSDRERDEVIDAIVNLGLRPGLDAYDKRTGWTKVNNNQNLVCNGGMIVGALAIMDEEPRLSREILSNARDSIRNGLGAFAPDGGWDEGPTYWTYATRYLAYAISSLQDATGSDWGVLRTPGLSRTGLFRIYAEGPGGLAFNFGDSSATPSNSSQMLWLAQAFQRPVYASWERQSIGRDVGIFDLLRYRPVEPDLVSKLPLDAQFKGVEMVSMRGAWDDPNATFIAFKGGSTQAHHSHLDFGTFVLDALGQRWAVDLGSDDYELPGYFGDRRYSYYRISTRGHNTITLDNHNQNEKAVCPIVSFHSVANRSDAVIDLHEAYRENARRVMRGVALLDRRQVLIQDELDLSRTSDISWGFHTCANVRISGSTATLRQNDKTMTVQILSPAQARFDVTEIRLPSPQQPIENTRKLYIRLPDMKRPTTIAVLFTPGEEPARAPSIEPLSQWMTPR